MPPNIEELFLRRNFVDAIQKIEHCNKLKYIDIDPFALKEIKCFPNKYRNNPVEFFNIFAYDDDYEDEDEDIYLENKVKSMISNKNCIFFGEKKFTEKSFESIFDNDISSDIEKQCIVCFEKESLNILNHTCKIIYCDKCLDHIMTENVSRKVSEKCPYCRTKFENFEYKKI